MSATSSQPRFVPGRYAAIDIGTVTCRLLVADVDAQGAITELAHAYEVVNLGEGVDVSRQLKPEAIERVARAVEGYQETLAQVGEGPYGPAKVFAVATSASRDARNADEFRRRMEDIGIVPQVIPGEREAALSFSGASAGFEGSHVVVVDVGGGSTEIVAGLAGEGENTVARSFDIGCRRVTERFFLDDPPTETQIDDARMWMRDQFVPHFQMLRENGLLADATMVAVAGTATSVVSMREHMEVYDAQRVHHAVVTREDVDATIDWLAPMTLAERENIVGLDPRRAPVILAGVLVLQEVMEAGGFSAYTASESDILQGIVLDQARA